MAIRERSDRMFCSVRTPVTQAVFFLTEIPENPDGSLEIEEGAWVEVPMNVNLWPEGARRPESVLCRSTEDPKHYKIYKYRNEIEDTEWEEADVDFGGTFSKESWERFASRLDSIRALQAIPDGEGD